METAPRRPVDDLEAGFDKDTARALRAWADRLNRSVSLPSRPWRGAGHTGALVGAIVLGPADAATAGKIEKLIVKVSPAGRSAEEETRRHEAAWQSNPGFAQRHLVRQPYPPHPIGDGRLLMFQAIAGNLHEITPASMLPVGHRPAVLGETTRLVLEEWNDRGLRRRTESAAEYLRIELREVLAGAAAVPDADWIRTERDSSAVALPNPTRLAAPDSLISGVDIDYLAGHAHGDLHLANVLVPLPPGRAPVLGGIRLIDNPTYSDNAPLTRDPVTLMLSALLTVVGTLPDDQAERLMDYVVTPREEFPVQLPPIYAEMIWSTYLPGINFAGSMGEEWRAQYLLSLVAHALAHSSFENAGPAGRWWYFRLAARAGAAFLADLPDSPALGPAHLIEPVDLIESTAAKRAGEARLRLPVVMSPFYGEPMIERWALIEQVIGLLRDPTRRIVALGALLEGTGGFGKTVLAREICGREEIQQLFADGILWIDIGGGIDGAELAAKINDVSELLSGHRPTLSMPEVAGAHLTRLIGDKSMLLVIDDVWTRGQLRPFLHGAPRCVRLVTTRNRTLASPDTPAITVGEMERAEAVELLTAGISMPPSPAIDDLLRITGRWPLLLSLVNRAVRGAVRDGATVADATNEVLTRLRAGGPTALDLTNAGDRSVAVQATMRACLAPLDQDHLERFTELSIFNEDAEVSLEVLEPYWNLPPDEVVRRCETFANHSLLAFRRGARSAIRLHDVIRTYLRDRCGPHRLVALNRRLLDATRPLPSPDGRTPWWELPAAQEYLWRSLVYHLTEAGLHEELTSLLSDLRYVTAKLEMLGPVPVEADLAAGSGPFARELLWGLQRSSHLLTATRPASSVADVFLSRLGDVTELRRSIVAFRETAPGNRLREGWPPPDLPHPSLRRIVQGHTGSVGGCALSRDGARLITAGDDSARVWDMTSGRLLSVLEGHAGPVLSCAISPDGSWAATTSDDHTVRLWDLNTGDERLVLTGHDAVVRRCAISPDGTWLASAGDDHLVRVWDAVTGAQLTQLAGHTGAVRSCAISADGRRLVSAGGDGTVRVWDVADGTLRVVCEGHAGAVRNCAMSPDGSWVVSAGGDGTARRWDATTGRLDALLTGHRGSVRACAISPDARLIVTGGSDGTVRLWDAFSGRRLTVLSGHDAAVRGLVVSEDMAWLITVAEDRTIRTWDLRRALARPTTSFRRRSVARACAAFPNDDRLATGGTDGAVRIWDTVTGRLLHLLRGHESAVRSCAVSPDGGTLATGGDDAIMRLWDSADGTLSATLAGHRAAIRDCAFGPDGTWLVTAASDGLIRVWDVATRAVRREFGRPGVAIWSCAIPPHGGWLATVGDDSLVRLWDVESGALWAELAGHRGTTLGCAAGPDGEWVVTVGNDHVMRLWDVAGRRQLHAFAGHQAWLNACCTSPDGRWAASAGYDSNVLVWDTASREVLTELSGHQGVIWALAAGGGGRWLAGAAADETIRIWNPWTAAPLAVIDLNATALRACAPAPNGDWVVCAGGAGAVYRLDMPDGRRTDLAADVDVTHNACAVSMDGSIVAIGGEDGGIRLWNTETDAVRDVGLRHPGAVLSCAFGPDDSLLATSGGDGLVIVWDLPRRRRLWALEGHAGWVRACVIARDGRWLVSGGDDGTVRVWDLGVGGQRLEIQGGRIRACAIAPDGTWFACGGDDGVVRIWSLDDGALMAEFPGHSAPVLDCPVSHDGQLVAAVTDKEVHIWNVRDRERVAAMRVEQPLRGGTWIAGGRGLCLVGEAGAYRYDL